MLDAAAELSERFYEYFEIVYADTPELKARAYQLRYEVYCAEGKIPGFDLSHYPNSEESDDYDQRSLHALLIHKPSGFTAGTVRLVTCEQNNPLSLLPVEEFAGPLSDYVKSCPDRQHVAEISRFILSPRFRCRRGEVDFVDGLAEDTITPNPMPHNRRLLAHPVIGLIKACVWLSWIHGIRFWSAGMEPRLYRRLKQFGMELDPLGSAVEYHGPVDLYLSHIPSVMSRCKSYNPVIWDFLTDYGRMWPTIAMQTDAPNGAGTGLLQNSITAASRLGASIPH